MSRLKRLPGILLATLLATAASPARAGDTQAFVCLGTEPFWRLDLVGHQARLTTPEAPARHFAGGFTALDYLGVVAWRGAPWAAGAGDLVAVIETGQCNDGMSDEEFPRRVRVSLPGGVLLAGCCRPAQSSGDRSP